MREKKKNLRFKGILLEEEVKQVKLRILFLYAKQSINFGVVYFREIGEKFNVNPPRLLLSINFFKSRAKEINSVFKRYFFGV